MSVNMIIHIEEKKIKKTTKQMLDEAINKPQKFELENICGTITRRMDND